MFAAFAGLVHPDGEYWHYSYCLGLLSAGVLTKLYYPTSSVFDMGVSGEAPLPLIIVAGLLVGYGTRVAGGCTSGHGLCGLSRLSPRFVNNSSRNSCSFYLASC